ncbi:Ctr-domain-containing protein [Basidiobolus meristosporus CBS 931.73]|uniref:Copper transport protein n=1 Tax=Basidiobolus meristosporus CBS 931.73 TaxID=1314790 RepID=A0A1Y1Z5Z2_9FUNG|nr:Ctr-domain-containing protein [Basidiobolus meristosporus CBS 931.73]|eukprot:ORY05660.1 Ctr-domain-containing protein [Basidiobolus meristosporus CBS 931.73]
MKISSALITSFLAFLASNVRAQDHSGHGGMTPSNDTSIPMSNACYTDPSNANCADFQMDAATLNASIQSLCNAMPYMPGCSVNNLCNATTTYSSKPWCSKMSIVADVCQTDMPKMSGCKAWVSLCGNSTSVVKQCKSEPEIPNIPTTAEASGFITSICTEMNMPGCEKCKSSSGMSKRQMDMSGSQTCDYLSVYSDLCKSMPNMSQCQKWSSMCTATKDLPYCTAGSTSDGEPAPSMIMYFHTGIHEYILFKNWIPKTSGQMAGAWFAIFFIGVFYEGFGVFRGNLEANWAATNQPCTSLSLGSFTASLPRDCVRLVMRFIDATIGYSLMLVTMTFNVALFFAVITGLAFGTFLFAKFRAASSEPKSGCH